MYTLLTIIFYMAFLLLIMQPTISAILITLLLAVIGASVILLSKKHVTESPVSIPSVAITLYLVVYLGKVFYEQWIPSSMVRSIAAILHIPTRVLVMLTALCLCICSAIFMARMIQLMHESVKAQLDSRKFSGVLSCCFVMSLATVMISQLMLGMCILSMGILKFCAGVLIVFVAILTLYCITGRMKISILLGTGIFILISVVNLYVYRFRGRLFEPVDLFSAGTAMNVAENYSFFPIPHGIYFGGFLWLALQIWIYRISSGTKQKMCGKTRCILSLGCLFGIILLSCYTSNLRTYHWDLDGVCFNGYLLDFTAKIKEMHIQKPDGYSVEHIEELADQYTQDTVLPENDTKPPHIIVIMDEAFSDMSVLGSLSTNQEVMPFVSSLDQNVISGYALASVYGGNTANSEYEFLTGNTMAWLSPNTVPYQQYIRTPTYSMVSYLKTNYNYHCIAMHPYLSSGWNRPEVYRHLGFDACYFMEDFPQKQYIRDFVSDQEMFEVIVDTYEQKDQDPLFLFGVSMQNHGGYTYRGENYSPSISLDGLAHDYPEVEQYLSLIHETDNAVEYLLSYFEQVNEDVVIVFFGDHQPKIEESFYRDLGSDDAASLDIQQKRFMVPFFVWANYDLEEQYIACTSLNYLSSYVYAAAGIPLPPYNQFLREMEDVIPAINANGFYSLTAQCYLPIHMATGEEQEWLHLYEQLQYNSIADIKNRNESIFPILG